MAKSVRRIRRIALLTTAPLLLMALSIDLPAANKDKAQKSAGSSVGKAKGAKPDKLQTELDRLFKTWDGDKSGEVTKDELKKSFRALAPKGKKAAAAANANGADLPAPVQALLDKIDEDKDSQISADEFGKWSADFGKYLAQIVETQNQAIAAQRQIAELQAAMGGRNVTAAEGTGNDLLRQGVIRYELQLRDAETKLQTLRSEGGHSDYEELVHQEIFRRIKR